MRKASSVKAFPYNLKTMCYIGVNKTGEVYAIGSTAEERKVAYEKALVGYYQLYAMWPGEFTSNLFIIDDISCFGDAYGFNKPSEHKHHVVYRFAQDDDGKSHYAQIIVCFHCDCVFRFCDVKKLANEMLHQKGWEVVVENGLGIISNGDVKEYRVCALRKSLT